MPPILDLPAELLLRITEYLPLHAVKSTSLANAQLRHFLQPSLFKCLRATNREDDEGSIRSAIEKYGRYVEKLAFELHLTPGDGDDDSLYNVGNEPGQPDCEPATHQHGISMFARELLSGEMLPGLAELKLTFMPVDDFEGSDWGDDDGCGSIYVHQDPESQHEVSEREQSLMWRANINETYRALACRKGINRLELLQVVPRACSPFDTVERRTFLGTLEQLCFTLWGGDNGVAPSNSMPGYLAYCEAMNNLVFAHLKRLVKLRLVAYSRSPMGMNGENHHLPTPIRPPDMPKLMDLEIENFFLDPDLAEFVGSHSQVLSSLSLKECFAKRRAYSWSEFFQALRECKPALKTFTAINDRVPLTDDETFHDRSTPFVPSDDEPNDIKLVRKKVSEQPGLRLWPYAYLHGKYGDAYQSGEDNVEAFKAGHDQEEYAAFMHFVHGNLVR